MPGRPVDRIIAGRREEAHHRPKAPPVRPIGLCLSCARQGGQRKEAAHWDWKLRAPASNAGSETEKQEFGRIGWMEIHDADERGHQSMGDKRQPDPSLKAEVTERRNGNQCCQTHRCIAHHVIVPEQGMWGLFENANSVSRPFKHRRTGPRRWRCPRSGGKPTRSGR